jgi:hypothetical protein
MVWPPLPYSSCSQFIMPKDDKKCIHVISRKFRDAEKNFSFQYSKNLMRRKTPQRKKKKNFRYETCSRKKKKVLYYFILFFVNQTFIKKKTRNIEKSVSNSQNR